MRRGATLPRMRVMHVVVSVVLVAVALVGQRPSKLQNGGFEHGAIGEVPDGWFQPGFCVEAGFALRTVAREERDGRCAEISRAKGEDKFGNCLQEIDATPISARVLFAAHPLVGRAPGRQAEAAVCNIETRHPYHRRP